MTILEEIADYAKERVKHRQAVKSLQELREQALALPKGEFTFRKAISKTGISFICECKKASPSKGIISDDFPYLKIAKEYEEAGAAAISVLTEPKYFLGSDEYLREICQTVALPCLRKDFVVDEYMLYEAKVLGAKAILLICSLLSKKQLSDYLCICEELGLDALVEVHDAVEVAAALAGGAKIIGVNNRNLQDFSVDINNSQRLRSFVPKDILFVAESGIRTARDIQKLREAGVDAVLIGEALMTAPDIKKFLRELQDG